MEMSQKIDLYSHPFTKSVSEEILPLAKMSTQRLIEIAKVGKIRAESKQAVAENQYYHLEVFRKACALLNCISQLEDIIKLIKRFPSPKTYEKQGISQYRWIEYHYSYFVVTLVSLNDTTFLLVNAVLRLGYPERHCRAELILSNKWVKNTGICESIKHLEKVIGHNREIRNIYIHRGEAPELYRVFQLDIFDHLAFHSHLELCGNSIIDKKLLRIAYRGEVKKMCKILERQILDTKEAVWRIFDSLFPTYQKCLALLREASIKET